MTQRTQLLSVTAGLPAGELVILPEYTPAHTLVQCCVLSLWLTASQQDTRPRKSCFWGFFALEIYFFPCQLGNYLIDSCFILVYVSKLIEE